MIFAVKFFNKDKLEKCFIMRDTELKTNKYDFIINNLGHDEVPMAQRAFVLCRILHELNIPYRKYYTSSQHRYLRGCLKESSDFSDMGVVLIGVCSDSYANYALYLYDKRMEEIKKLNKMMTN